MKKRNFKLLCSILIVFFSTTCFAGNEFGGGFILESNGKSKLFDFYEHGLTSVDITPYPDYGQFKSQIDGLGFSKKVSESILFKLNDIYSRSPEFAQHLAQILFRFSWYVVNVEFKRLEDLGPSPIDYSKLVLTPTALRNKENFTIYISKEFFEKLEVPHQVGLIFHETLGAYLEMCPEQMIFDSSKSRKINAFLFNPRVSKSFLALQKTMTSLQVDRFVPLNDDSKKSDNNSDQVGRVYFNWGTNLVHRPHDREFNFFYQDLKNYKNVRSDCLGSVALFKKTTASLESRINLLNEKYLQTTNPLFDIELKKYPEIIDQYGEYLNMYWSIQTDLSTFIDSCFGSGESNSGKCVIKPRISYWLAHRNNSSWNKPSVTVEWIEKNEYRELVILKNSFDKIVTKMGTVPYSKCPLEIQSLLNSERLLRQLEFVP